MPTIQGASNMARTKKVSTHEILDAVERVVVKFGVSRLSIDVVAREAGISKSRVVYDYKSKTALLEALIDRQFQRDKERIDILVLECAETPHPELFARIKRAEQAPDDIERAVALAVSSSMSSEVSLQRKMREWTVHDLKAMEAGEKPEAARIVYFALIGFNCHEWFGLVNWSNQERFSFLEGIRAMYASHTESQAPTSHIT